MVPTFENCIETINTEINKRKNKWNLSILAWMDFDDVAQILRIHIWKKWHQYDPARPLSPWLNRIITRQITNLVRNHYGNYCRPCLRCAAAEGEFNCRIYEKQCSKCPLYSNWEKTRKQAHDTKLPVPLEIHTQEVHNKIDDMINIEAAIPHVHRKMQEILKPLEWKIYQYVYIEHKSDEEVAKLMEYKTSEKGRHPGYKWIKHVKKSIIAKVKKAFDKGCIDIY